MKKLIALMAAAWLFSSANAQETPLWLRHCAISPDGSTIAFTYKGDVYTVPSGGGRAFQLTTNAAYDSEPVWSPDGQRIAFASDRLGSLDVYVVSKDGGEPLRLTTHSGDETPVAFRDNDHVLFLASILPSAEAVTFPGSRNQQVYQVSVDGGRPELFSSIPMERISVGADGSMLYQDKKGYEDYWRKHHRSPITRDIWLYNPAGQGAYQKLTTFDGEDRDPVWAADGKSFFYLSEENGTFNVFQRSLDGTSVRQLTHHTVHPVRFLSVADNGLLCYGYDGELYTLKPGDTSSRKVEVSIVSDKNDRDLIRQIKSNGATDMAVSPDGKEVAFIVRGDVYVTSVDYKTTKQITNTPDQERSLSFSPDGRKLVYASERNGLWQIYMASIVRADEKLFTYASEVKEERLTHSSATSFQPQFSPDGKEVAFLENRAAIRVINLETKAVRTVMDGQYAYSYSDGDQWFQWSPDSKWILAHYIGVGGWNSPNVVLLPADGQGEMVDLTQSGYSDVAPRWVLDGKAMIWFSDRAGYRSHGSWGAHSDAYIMFFDVDAYDRFRMTKEERALLKEAEDAEAKAEEKKADGKKKDKADKAEKPVEPLQFDLDNRFDRIVRLTVASSRMGDAYLTQEGDALYYTAAFEGGYDLWKHDFRENTTKLLLKDVGGDRLMADKDGKNLYLCARGALKKINLKDNKVTPIEFEAFFNYRPYEERSYIFDHAWQQVKDKFYKADLHGVDWDGYHKAYSRFLPFVNNNYDFAELLSEMLGELNGSHTGARYAGIDTALPTASLGLFYDPAYTGDGLRIKEVMARSPLAQKKTQVTVGCVIEQIDGTAIRAGQDYFPLLEGKVGRKVRLTIYNPATEQRFEETVKAIGQAQELDLLYHRWVERCRQKVEELSGGRIGYVHIKGMDSPSFRTLYSELLGRNRHKEAVIVDTRHNGGGWLHDDVVTLLSGKEYRRFVAKGQYIGSDPHNKWLKPSCMLVCEDNYSNAHGTPWVYQALRVGPLVGAPVAGTMTAVWWERQIDPTLVFGIPMVGWVDKQGGYAENTTLQPDVLQYNAPQEVMRGEDAQLKAAVDCLLKQLDEPQK